MSAEDNEAGTLWDEVLTTGLRRIAGPSGIVSFDGTTIKVKSERFRVMDEIHADEHVSTQYGPFRQKSRVRTQSIRS